MGRCAMCWTASAVLMSLALGGCMAHRQSYDLRGERVELHLLTSSALASYPQRLGWDGAKTKLYQQRLSELSPPQGVAALAAAAPMLAGVAIDLIRTELELDAQRYDQSYQGQVVSDQFWETPQRPAWTALEILRFSDAGPALRTVLMLVPSRHDPRVFLLQPLYWELQRAKAKISGHQGLWSLDLRLEGFWFDAKGAIHQDQIGEVFWTRGFDLDQPGGEFFLGQREPIGAVPGVPLSWTDEAKPVRLESGGVMRWVALISETDPTHPGLRRQQAAEVTGAARGAVVKLADPGR